ncbi:MAG TPA: asparagine synthase [Microbacterium sp.]|uniref:asparagine synthase n=1 Tax=Microbacterium sp. TaxID=51671 RepID=UPI002BC714E0|nr:asparagine synthase [Microbacterium sp.]HWI30610.1 asparagine synthase [Microbacterium sp.]
MGRNADAVAEGIAIAQSAARLSVKNSILVGTISLGEPFEPPRFIPVAREALISLAMEAEEAASLAHRQRKAAWGQYSQPDGTHDYRDRDVRNLRRRRRQYLRVAQELRRRADDPVALDGLVEAAREAAWSDVESNLERRLAVEGMRADADPDYEVMRPARMQALRLVDLERLASQHRHRLAAETAASDADGVEGS